MLPDPMHPAVVHFPIVFMILLPLIALGALWAINRGSPQRRVWAAPVALAAALTASAWVAVETGESQEEKVEEAVSETPLKAHEESAEQFLWLSGALLVLTGAGLLSGRAGGAARIAATLGAVGLAAVGAQVGHTGGKLVYQYGAASAYAQPGAVAEQGGEAGEGSDAPQGAALGVPRTGRERDGDD
jgi:uncharacterized membrane protein